MTVTPELFTENEAAPELPEVEERQPAGTTDQGTTQERADGDEPAEAGTDRQPAERSFVANGHPIEMRSGAFVMSTTGSELVDRLGNPFDLSVHERDPRAEELWPVLTNRGLLRLKRGSPLPAKGTTEEPEFDDPRSQQRLASVLPFREPETPPAEPETRAHSQIGSDRNDIAASTFAAVLVATMSGLAGAWAGDWAKQSADESEKQTIAWTAYLETLDMSAPPPWAIPILALTPWAARIAADPRNPLRRADTPEPEASTRETPGPAPDLAEPFDPAEPSSVGLDS